MFCLAQTQSSAFSLQQSRIINRLGSICASGAVLSGHKGALGSVFFLLVSGAGRTPAKLTFRASLHLLSSCSCSCHRGVCPSPNSVRPMHTLTSSHYPRILPLSQPASPSSCLPSISTATGGERKWWTLPPPHSPPGASPSSEGIHLSPLILSSHSHPSSQD